MIAWVSPSRIVSVTPLRISLSSSSVLTETCRSLISRVLMLVGSPRSCVRRSEAGEAQNFVGYSLGGDSVQGGGDVDVHLGAAYLDGEGRHGFGGGKTGGLAGAEVEPRAVEPALERAALDLALAQRDRGMGADVLDREDLLAVASDRDLLVADLDRQRLGVAELVERAGQLVAHDWPPSTFLASSASTVAASCSSSSGTLIRRIRSLKNPCTTSRRASSSAMPRERR